MQINAPVHLYTDSFLLINSKMFNSMGLIIVVDNTSDEKALVSHIKEHLEIKGEKFYSYGSNVDYTAVSANKINYVITTLDVICQLGPQNIIDFTAGQVLENWLPNQVTHSYNLWQVKDLRTEINGLYHKMLLDKGLSGYWNKVTTTYTTDANIVYYA